MAKDYKDKTPEEKAAFNAYCINRWRQRKVKAIEYKGSKCHICGYNACPDVLEFHHLNPEEKDVDWQKLRLRSWTAITSELDKCVLLCANCHREEHFIHGALAQSG